MICYKPGRYGMGLDAGERDGLSKASICKRR